MFESYTKLHLCFLKNEAIRVILGTTKATPTEAMRFMLDFPPLQTRRKAEQGKASSSVMCKVLPAHSLKP